MKDHWSISKEKLVSLEEGSTRNEEVTTIKPAASYCSCPQFVQFIKLILYIELAIFLGWGCYSIWQTYRVQPIEFKGTDINPQQGNLLQPKLLDTTTPSSLEIETSLSLLRKIDGLLGGKEFPSESRVTDHEGDLLGKETLSADVATQTSSAEVRVISDSLSDGHTDDDSESQDTNSGPKTTVDGGEALLDRSDYDLSKSEESKEASLELARDKADVLVWAAPFLFSIHGLKFGNEDDISKNKGKELHETLGTTERLEHVRDQKMTQEQADSWSNEGSYSLEDDSMSAERNPPEHATQRFVQSSEVADPDALEVDKDKGTFTSSVILPWLVITPEETNEDMSGDDMLNPPQQLDVSSESREMLMSHDVHSESLPRSEDTSEQLDWDSSNIGASTTHRLRQYNCRENIINGVGVVQCENLSDYFDQAAKDEEYDQSDHKGLLNDYQSDIDYDEQQPISETLPFDDSINDDTPVYQSIPQTMPQSPDEPASHETSTGRFRCSFSLLGCGLLQAEDSKIGSEALHLNLDLDQKPHSAEMEETLGMEDHESHVDTVGVDSDDLSMESVQDDAFMVSDAIFTKMLREDIENSDRAVEMYLTRWNAYVSQVFKVYDQLYRSEDFGVRSTEIDPQASVLQERYYRDRLPNSRRNILMQRYIRSIRNEPKDEEQWPNTLVPQTKPIMDLRKDIHDKEVLLIEKIERVGGFDSPHMQEDVNNFFHRMDLLSAHIDRLQKRYLRLNKLQDDYISQELPPESAEEYTD